MFELANLAGVTQSGIASMEQRDYAACTIEGEKICKALGIDRPTPRPRGKISRLEMGLLV